MKAKGNHQPRNTTKEASRFSQAEQWLPSLAVLVRLKVSFAASHFYNPVYVIMIQGSLFSLTYLILALALWLFMDQASSLVVPWESSFRNGGPGRDFICLVHADYRYTCIISTRKNHTRRSMAFMSESD